MGDDESVLKRDVVLAQEYLAFLLLSLFDLFLSGYLFKNGGSEANGLAAYFWHISPFAFAVFKFVMVAIVLTACEGVSVKSVGRARAIITAGCVLYFALICYESYLIFDHVTGPKARRILQGPQVQTSLLQDRFANPVEFSRQALVDSQARC
jgi:hypothetical protein